MSAKKTGVFIIEDSRLYQAYLRRIIQSDESMEVAGVAGSAAEATRMLASAKPDVITLDLNLPDANGLDLLRKLGDVPVIVVTSQPESCEDAIQRGACDFIEKIQDTGKYEPEQFALLLRLKIKNQMAAARSEKSSEIHLPSAVAEKPLPAAAVKRPSEHIIAIGASLGGTEVLMKILRQLPANLPGIVVVQHMPEGFTNAFAMRLDKYCTIKVKEAKNGDFVLPGTALIARGGQQLRVVPCPDGYRVRTTPREFPDGFCPSVNGMFESVAAAAGEKAVGIILTGMGSDGTAGLVKMHNAGAFTLGQDKETCAIFGMPAAAQAAGAVDRMLTPDQIAAYLKKRLVPAQELEDKK